jgi:hypothetical protein
VAWSLAEECSTAAFAEEAQDPGSC